MNEPKGRGFSVVGEIEDEPPKPAAAPGQPAGQAVATQMLVMALSALAQRTVVAISNLFTLLTVGSAFWLWHSIPDPNPLQLVGLGMYALLVIGVNLIVRRK